MDNSINTLLWVGMGILVLGSVYLILQGYRVHKLFNDSIVGRLVKTLVVVLLIELYSLGIVSIAYLKFYPKGAVILVPILLLLIMSLVYATWAISMAKKEVTKLIK